MWRQWCLHMWRYQIYLHMWRYHVFIVSESLKFTEVYIINCFYLPAGTEVQPPVFSAGPVSDDHLCVWDTRQVVSWVLHVLEDGLECAGFLHCCGSAAWTLWVMRGSILAVTILPGHTPGNLQLFFHLHVMFYSTPPGMQKEAISHPRDSWHQLKVCFI